MNRSLPSAPVEFAVLRVSAPTAPSRHLEE
jgi:hypothetical protein